MCGFDLREDLGRNIESQLTRGLCVLRVRREVAESVFTREPKVGDKQSCLVAQALSHGSRKGRAELKPAQANSM